MGLKSKQFSLSANSSYSRQDQSKKMSKAGHKLAEYKIQSKNTNVAVCGLFMKLETIFLKPICWGFKCISSLHLQE